MQSVIVTSGGTGGHFIPALAFAIHLLKQGKSVIFVCDERCKQFDKKLIASGAKDFKNFYIHYKKIRRSSGRLVFYTDLALSTLWNIKTIFTKRVQGIISFGSYASVPSIVAGILTFRKIFLHEQNAVFGSVVKIFFPFAKKVFTTFNISGRGKVIHTGIPRLNIPIHNVEDVLNVISSTVDSLINPDLYHISVIGGSQGSDFLDKIIPQSLLLLSQFFKNTSTKLSITYQSRKENVEVVHKTLSRINNLHLLEVSSFFVNIDEKLSTTDIAIIRSGASSIIDCLYSEVFPVMIPIKNSKNNHQEENAQFCTLAGFGANMKEDDLTTQKLALTLFSIITQSSSFAPNEKDVYSHFPKNACQIIEDEMKK